MEDEYYIYDFENGMIISKFAGRPIGSKTNAGYIRFYNSIFGFKFVHRILYEKYHKTVIPHGMEVNHINGIKDDNRISNLELVSHRENVQHRGKQKNNKSGHKNVYWDKASNKWYVQICVTGKLKHYGYFVNLQDAIQARDNAIVDLNTNGHRYITQFPQT